MLKRSLFIVSLSPIGHAVHLMQPCFGRSTLATHGQ